MEKVRVQTLIKYFIIAITIISLTLFLGACGDKKEKTIDISGNYTPINLADFNNYISANNTTATFETGFQGKMKMDFTVSNATKTETVKTETNMWALINNDVLAGAKFITETDLGSAEGYIAKEGEIFYSYVNSSAGGKIEKYKEKIDVDANVSDVNLTGMDSFMTIEELYAFIQSPDNVEYLEYSSYTKGDITKFKVNVKSESSELLELRNFVLYFVFENNVLTGVQYDFAIDIDMMGVITTIDFSISMVPFDGTITYPSDLASYPEKMPENI